MNKDNSILIVEDDRITSKMLQKYITDLGYHVCGAVSTGEEAVEKAESLKPDIILMDITLEGKMDGIESAQRINENFKIPIIYITTSSDDFTMSRAKIANPFGFIIKPIDLKELKASIEMALLRHEMENMLIENEEKYSAILKSIGDAVIVTNSKGDITFFNPVAEIMTGYKRESVMGKPLERVIHIEDEKISFVKNYKNECDKEKSRYYIVSMNNKKIPVDYRITPLIDNKNNYVGTVMVVRDISERIRYEDRIHESFRVLRKAMGGVIHAMAQTVETRDPYTAGHQRRVANIARYIAERMSLPSDKIEGIRMAGVIHDLGKISIPAEILSKPGKITEVEFNLIKNHCQAGYDILKSIDFPWPIADIVYQHHERIDGSGYPGGITGDEIIIEAKIISVADVMEAMASHRPYRPSLGVDFALNEIEKNKGILYDKDVADTCIKMFRSGDVSIDDL